MPKAKYRILRTCQHCRKDYLARSINSRYCSSKCSDAAYRQRQRDQRKNEVLLAKGKTIPSSQIYLTIAEAETLFYVSKKTLYRCIIKGTLSRFGNRIIRLRRQELASKFQLRATAVTTLKPVPKLYKLELDDCYTVGEISKKFGVSPSTVYTNIRKFSIPIRQIGKERHASNAHGNQHGIPCG